MSRQSQPEQIRIYPHQGQYPFFRKKVGLRNTPISILKTTNVLLYIDNYQFDLGYFKNIVEFSKTYEKHSKHVCYVLMPLHDTNVTLRSNNCKLFNYSSDYLRYMVGQGRLGTASHTQDAIRVLMEVTFRAKASVISRTV